MKLYATVSSERATKGQGGNKYINIDLLSGNKKCPMIEYHIEYTAEGLEVWQDGEIITKASNWPYKNPYPQKSKGEKQKGE